MTLLERSYLSIRYDDEIVPTRATFIVNSNSQLGRMPNANRYSPAYYFLIHVGVFYLHLYKTY